MDIQTGKYWVWFKIRGEFERGRLLVDQGKGILVMAWDDLSLPEDQQVPERWLVVDLKKLIPLEATTWCNFDYPSEFSPEDVVSAQQT